MSSMSFLLVGVFLPLFPFSMLFNILFGRLDSAWMRIALLVAWPSTGVTLLSALGESPPQWLVYWSVATAAFYAFRALALRDFTLWLGHLATSTWALLWLPAVFIREGAWLLPQAAAFSVPLLILAWLGGRLEKAFGGAYAGSPGGLAASVPRLAGLLVLVVLAAIGTPLFPGFFALLGMVGELLPGMPLSALGILLVWMLWAWSGMRILQGLIVGQPVEDSRADIGLVHTGVLGVALAMFAVGGIWFSGSLV